MVAELEREPVFVEPYDQEWPAWFAAERERLLISLGSHVVTVDHIGSTAVPGLMAKPIIDILLGVGDMSDRSTLVSPLVAAGYAYIPEYEKTFPERLFFYRRQPRACHVHLVRADSEFRQRHLLFRDYLRAHPEARAAYARLKEELAKRFRHDRQAYLEGKSEFIRALQLEAEAERSHGLIK